ncbi:MAG: CubicO group peptidase (beta-lactamase class C family) [Saprospiraceae bacterium]|jgi:CubicO group peptidase (beta-lactamase class C family)
MKFVSPILVFIFFQVSMVAQTTYFPPNFSTDWETEEPSSFGWCDNGVEKMKVFHEESNTKAFIILKSGKIAIEFYYDDHEATTPWYWASAGKSLTANLIGIAQTEGLIDIENASSSYLGEEWTSCTEDQESQITVRHHLTMTTGLDYGASDQNCTDPSCLIFLNEPGDEWYYHNAPYTLLSQVISNASGQTYTSYTNERLTNKLGFLGLWSEAEGNQVFFSTARGMARFGLYMLSNGEWNGEQIFSDEVYFQSMTNTSQSINEAYGYLWWLNGKDSYRLPGTTLTFNGSLVSDAPDDMYAAIGKNGQICMVVPSQDLVIIRMGNNPDASLVPITYLRDLWSQYEQLSCSNSAEQSATPSVTVWPRLTSSYLHFKSDLSIERVDIINRRGRIVMSVADVDVLDIGLLQNGIYFVRIIVNNHAITKRIMKVD